MSKYVVIDLEMCEVPKCKRSPEYRWANETIQIGAVLIDDSLEVVDEFSTLVAPEYGEMTKFIEKFTGIRATELVGAPSMKEALEMFAEWAPEDAIIVSWSENDEVQIRREIQGKGIFIPKLEEMMCNWVDSQVVFADKMDTSKRYNLMNALNISNIDYDERLHNALYDAYNTALLYIKMLKEPVLKLSPYYHKEPVDTVLTSNPFASLFDGMGLVAFS